MMDLFDNAAMGAQISSIAAGIILRLTPKPWSLYPSASEPVKPAPWRQFPV